jgi:hypothetical protein
MLGISHNLEFSTPSVPSPTLILRLIIFLLGIFRDEC